MTRAGAASVLCEVLCLEPTLLEDESKSFKLDEHFSCDRTVPWLSDHMILLEVTAGRQGRVPCRKSSSQVAVERFAVAWSSSQAPSRPSEQRRKFETNWSLIP